MSVVTPSAATPGDFAPMVAAFADGVIVLPQCRECGVWTWTPSDQCRGCDRFGVEWTAVPDPVGTLFTFTVVWHTSLVDYADRVPFVVGLVDVADTGIRIPGLIDCQPGAVDIGTRLRPQFGSQASGGPLLRWQP